VSRSQGRTEEACDHLRRAKDMLTEVGALIWVRRAEEALADLVG
jgi:hypothetical protein